MARAAVTEDRRIWCILPAAIWMVFAIVVPLAAIGRIILTNRLRLPEMIRHMVTSPLYQRAIVNTFEIAALVAVGSILVAYPIAYLILHSSDAYRKAILGIAVASMWLSVLIRSYSWTVLLATGGPVSKLIFNFGLTREPTSLLFSKATVVIAMIHILAPYVILSIWSINSNVVQMQLPVAQSFGASRGLYLTRIFVPQSLPSALGGGALVFLLSIGFLITPELLGGGQGNTMMIAVLINEQIMQFGNWAQGAILAACLLVLVIALFLIFWRFWAALSRSALKERPQ